MGSEFGSEYLSQMKNWQNKTMSEEISIFVRSMDEKKESILIKPSDSIRRLKELVHGKFGGY